MTNFSDYALRLLAGESVVKNFDRISDNLKAAQLGVVNANNLVADSGGRTADEIAEDQELEALVAELLRKLLELKAKLEALKAARQASAQKRLEEAKLALEIANENLRKALSINKGRLVVYDDPDASAFYLDRERFHLDNRKLLELDLRLKFGAGALEARNAEYEKKLLASELARLAAELARLAAEKALLEGNAAAAQKYKLLEAQKNAEAVAAAKAAELAKTEAVNAARLEERRIASENAAKAAKLADEARMKEVDEAVSREQAAKDEAIKELLIKNELERQAKMAEAEAAHKKSMDELEAKRLSDLANLKNEFDHTAGGYLNRGLDYLGDKANQATDWVKNNPGKAAGYGAAGAAGIYGLYKLYKYLKNKKNKTPLEVQLMNDAALLIATKRLNFSSMNNFSDKDPKEVLKNEVSVIDSDNYWKHSKLKSILKAIFYNIGTLGFYGVYKSLHMLFTSYRTGAQVLAAILSKYPKKELLIKELNTMISKGAKKDDKIANLVTKLKSCRSDDDYRTVVSSIANDMNKRYLVPALIMGVIPYINLITMPIWESMYVYQDDFQKEMNRADKGSDYKANTVLQHTYNFAEAKVSESNNSNAEFSDKFDQLVKKISNFSKIESDSKSDDYGSYLGRLAAYNA